MSEPTITAWHNDPALKAEAVARMRAHRDADEFIRGSYLRTDPDKAGGYRGCFHGCLTTEKLAAERGVTVTSLVNQYLRDEERAPWDDIAWHDEAERIWGIPADLAGLLDDTFEWQPPEHAGVFAVECVEAIPVGADLPQVPVRLALEMLEGGAGYDGDRDEHDVQVAALLRRRLAGDEPDGSEWAAACDRLEGSTTSSEIASAAAGVISWRILTELWDDRQAFTAALLHKLRTATRPGQLQHTCGDPAATEDCQACEVELDKQFERLADR